MLSSTAEDEEIEVRTSVGKKRMKTLQRKIKTGKLNVNEDDPFELFVASTNIRYCYYSETHKILGNTFGMCILQDFEALTPNLLARTIETVEGGGMIVLLLRSVASLKQLYTMTMDVHERFRTEAHNDVVARFNERFLLSLASCPRCLVVDDQLTVLPVSSHNLRVEPVEKSDERVDRELVSIKESVQDLKPVGVLVNQCKTTDQASETFYVNSHIKFVFIDMTILQAKAVLKFIEGISEKTLRSTVSLTAARGRGKSAALGLSIAAAVAFGYSNIFVTSPSPENLNTLFEFVFKGFDALEYQEHLDYDLIQSTNPEFNKAIVRVNIFRDHRQTIQYIHPTDAHKLGQAELVVIDEAAAIPLPYVKAMLGPYLVFLASTINGYEGTGRSLSLKLLQQLRTQAALVGVTADKEKLKSVATGRTLHEVVLEESIRYRPGDMVEQDTLFCFHKASESFLQRLVALFVASHYKNSPNDLQMMSDAPAHHLFCLLGPVDPNQNFLPEVLVVIQVCLEGQVSKNSVVDGLSRGKRAHGDLIPWSVAQQFQDQDFPMLSGARIVRIATHPDYHGMGYGSRALAILKQYYEMKIPCIDEEKLPEDHIESISAEEVGLLEEHIVPRKSLPPLLLKLSERPPEHLDYLGVSYGLTLPLLKFWKRAGFVPVYLRQTTNDLTGEHSCIMLQQLHVTDTEEYTDRGGRWLPEFFADFRRRFISLLGYQFSRFVPALALSVIQNKACKIPVKDLSKEELDAYMTNYDVKRLEMYSNNMADYHLVMDLLPALSKLYFLNLMGSTHLSAVQAAILLGLGLQHKTVDILSSELELPSSQLLGLFNRTVRRCVQYLNGVMEHSVEKGMVQPRADGSALNPVAKSMHQELEEVAKELKVKQKAELEKLKKENLAQYAIKGSDEDWGKILASKSSRAIVSVKSGEKRIAEEEPKIENTFKKKKTKKRFDT
uniref:RNA cytidine acetyltransferase n=1 Tax=Timema poppense TaxID=170557 RepID=A0A7R9CYW2_TIMPO|nr:unnamed protein product [Timema poppensis]